MWLAIMPTAEADEDEPHVAAAPNRSEVGATFTSPIVIVDLEIQGSGYSL